MNTNEIKAEVVQKYRFEEIGFNEYKDLIANIPHTYCVVSENAAGCIIHWVSPQTGNSIARADYVGGQLAKYFKIIKQV